MAEARSSSRNADMQTEHNKEFPTLFEARTRKQARTFGKKRFTLLIECIENHMNKGNRKSKLIFLRKELANQLEECTRAHNMLARRMDKHQYECEKESELEKMRLNFDERLARHTFVHNGQ
ncbi:hypothetical protein GHT06_020515 [Daphnia sinensis]|uniref:Uncharacterized protein n=1 Tax=Daphnia sinensis TaxID=1820382 RepID=A0AAD5PQ22_9CRUS|nr:hypothetical protein GHT06_020515 [Daphnia sinensis]